MAIVIDIDLTIRNYRCFGDEPTHLRISDGFTAFVGVNNSGKSSLLRLLYEVRPLLQYLGSTRSPDVTNVYQGRRTGGRQWAPTLLDGERAFRTDAHRDIELDFIVRNGPRGPFVQGSEQVAFKIEYSPDGITSGELRTERGSVMERRIDPEPFAAAMRELADTLYVGPFRNAINVGAQQNYYDIQTGDAFVGTFAQYKSGGDPTQNEAVFHLIGELRRIFDFSSLDINASPDRKTLQLIADGRSYRLTEQGAGLAHFVVVLANVLVKRPSFLLIDEPELNLHASLQLDFLSTLASYTRNGVIFATHSLGLARTGADRIYTLAKPTGEASRVRQYDADRELVTLLGQLSFDRRPDHGFSKVLLVEGKTELRALMQFLRLYHKEHEVLMLPLHGDELIRPGVAQELSDLLRLGGDIHYLIDSERAEKRADLSKNRQGFVDLCTSLAIAGHVLERRALENYFTEEAVRRAFGESATALGPYEKKGTAQGWPKTHNWRIAALMSRSDLDGTDLGEFLDGL
jgi:ABC-type cobalamin/Fe3+-siderophores transport system ATPase subunit